MKWTEESLKTVIEYDSPEEKAAFTQLLVSVMQPELELPQCPAAVLMTEYGLVILP